MVRSSPKNSGAGGPLYFFAFKELKGFDRNANDVIVPPGVEGLVWMSDPGQLYIDTSVQQCNGRQCRQCRQCNGMTGHLNKLQIEAF